MVTSDIEDRAKFHPPSGRFYVIRREDANVGVGKSVGFAEITPYADNSMMKYQPLGTMDRYRSSAVFMELRL